VSSLVSRLKRIKLKKIVATVKKTVSDASHVAESYASGGIAGGLSAIGGLSKKNSPEVVDAAVYGSAAAAGAADATNAARTASVFPSNNAGMIFVGAAVLVILMMVATKKRG